MVNKNCVISLNCNKTVDLLTKMIYFVTITNTNKSFYFSKYCLLFLQNKIYHFLIDNFVLFCVLFVLVIQKQHMHIYYPSKQDTTTECLTNVGPPSTTLAQHWSNIGWLCRVCWDGTQLEVLSRHYLGGIISGAGMSGSPIIVQSSHLV